MNPNFPNLRSAFIKQCSALLILCFSFFSVHAQQPVTKGKNDLSGNSAKRSVINSSRGRIDETDIPSVIYLNAVHIDALSAVAQSARKAVNSFAGKQMHLVKFQGAIQPAWYKLMTDAGVEVVDYIPNYAYMVFGDYTSIQKLQAQAKIEKSPIVWDGEYLPEYRISPDVYGVGSKGDVDKNIVPYDRFSVQLFFNEATNATTIKLINDLKNLGTINYEQRISHYVNITVSLTPDALKKISECPDVISIHTYIEPRKNDESQNMIMTGQLTGNGPTPGNYLTYLAGKGFTQAQFDASGFVVNLSDDGLDNGATGGVLNTTNHFALYKTGSTSNTSRVAFIHKQGTSTDADTKGCDGHGNLNTHIIGGYVPDALIASSTHTDANGFRYGLGVAPFVKVGNSTIFRIGGAFSNPTYANVEAESYRDGGRISSNSWGAAVAGAYNADAQAYDFLVRDAQPSTSSVPTAGNQEMVIFFSAGNDGSGAGTIGSPGTGKNVITVGATEGVRPMGAADNCGVTDADANSANDIVGFSSRGPCTDGRKKPDIVAPGTHITGGVFPSAVTNPTSGTGTANACFNGNGVCGGTAGSNFFPSGQQWSTASSGTSHSTPATAGFGALIRQNFINRSLAAPSPAMTKAMIMNSASYMNGAGANDNLYSNNQGMGRVNMNNYFDALDNPNILRDEQAADMFTASGQSFVRSGVVANNALPVRVTLAYTDAPGPTSGNSYVNNLDLEVTVNGITYLGNVFTGAFSTAGGTADAKDNVESVFLPAGTTGTILVKVKATNIAGDGVPNVGTALDQDFALIVTNINEVPTPVLSSTTATIVAEGCPPANGVIDPGETVTVSFCLQNVGTGNTANLVGTLLATGGVTAPGAAQNYGVVTAGGAAVCKSFSFTANGTCGSTITASIQMQDGATNLGTLTYSFILGVAGAPATVTFTNPAVITIPASGFTGSASGDPSNPYPSTITVSGIASPITKVTVDLVGLSHTFPADADMLLVSPTGQKFIILSDVIGGTDWVNINYTLDDAAAAVIPATGTPASGTFKPTNYGAGDVFPAPAPAGPYLSPATDGTATFASAFNGSNANGVWSLYIVDDASVDVGTMAGGWKLNITTQTYSCCTGAAVPTTIVATAGTPQSAIVSTNFATPLQATVTGVGAVPINGATVTFTAPGAGASGTFPGASLTATATTNASGVATAPTFTANATAGGPYNVTATVTGVATPANFALTNLPAGSCVLTCPANVVVSNTTGQCGAVVTYPAPTGVGTCGTISSSPASGSFFPVGTTTVTATSTGGGSCSFTVTVNDTQVPVITCPANIVKSTDPGLCTAVVTFTPTATDNCPGVTITSTPASGSVFPKGVTTVTSKATDAAGNIATCTFTVTVNDTQLPVITCPANIVKSTDPGTCGAVVTFTPTATDNCPGVTITSTPASGSVFPKGVTTVTSKATDASGNIATCTFTVTVNDTQVPVITCPANITVNNTPGQCGAAVAFTPTATDNCPGVTIASTPASGSVFPVGTTTVTSTATDASGNTATCTFTVTVKDAEVPVITCPADIVKTTAIGQCTTVVTFTTTVTDNCSATIVSTPASGSVFPIGVTTVTSTATDPGGNVSSCTFKVTVIDAQLPVITTQPVPTAICEGQTGTISVVSTNAVSYQWQVFTNGAWVNVPGATGATLTLSNVTLSMNNNQYRVQVIGLCTTVTSSFVALTVRRNPVVALTGASYISLNPSVPAVIYSTVSPVGTYTYQWTRNGVVMPGVTSSSFPLSVDLYGVYQVKVTDVSTGCFNTSNTVTVKDSASSRLFVYPNPNKGNFQVRFYNAGGATTARTLNVYDDKGARVFTKPYATSAIYERMDVNISNYAAGIYMIEVRDASGKRLAAAKVRKQ